MNSHMCIHVKLYHFYTITAGKNSKIRLHRNDIPLLRNNEKKKHSNECRHLVRCFIFTSNTSKRARSHTYNGYLFAFCSLSLKSI